jgi:hypothetical protein
LKGCSFLGSIDLHTKSPLEAAKTVTFWPLGAKSRVTSM